MLQYWPILGCSSIWDLKYSLNWFISRMENLISKNLGIYQKAYKCSSGKHQNVYFVYFDFLTQVTRFDMRGQK